jgi:predicted DNA-binding protein
MHRGLGENMKKFEKQMPLYLTSELYEWLENKAKMGYKKAPLIRHILEEYRMAELNGQH